MRVRCKVCYVAYDASEGHRCRGKLLPPAPPGSAVVAEAGPVVRIRADPGEICPACGQRVRGPAKTAAERQRAYRERKAARDG